MKKPALQPEKLRLLLEVARAGSVSRIALQEHSSQPYISKVIAEVEADCGARIFRRTGRGLRPTDFGTAILPRIEAWLAAGHDMAEEIRSLAGAATGQVRLATLPNLSSPLMGALYLRTQESFPGIRLGFVEGYVEQVRAWLEGGQADIGVTLRYEPSSRAVVHHLVDFDLYLCSGPTDRLTRSPEVDFTSLDGLPLVLHSIPGLLHRRLKALFAERGMALNARVEATSLGIQKDIAASGAAYALLSHSAIAADLHSGRLQASRIVNPALTQHVDLAFSSQAATSRPCLEVARLLQALVAEAANKGVFPGPKPRRR